MDNSKINDELRSSILRKQRYSKSKTKKKIILNGKNYFHSIEKKVAKKFSSQIN